MTTSQRIKNLGYKQKEFAELLGITQSYLSEILRGKKTPRSRLIRQVEELLLKLEDQEGKKYNRRRKWRKRKRI